MGLHRLVGLCVLSQLIGVFVGIPSPCSAQALVEPVLLLKYAQGSPVSDYRPVLDPTGKRVIFERTYPDPVTGKETRPDLFIAELGSNDAPRALAPTLMFSARPDWCWTGPSDYASGPVAFSNGRGIWTVDPDKPGSLRLLPDTSDLIYPSWYAGCRRLVTMDIPTAESAPVTTAIDARTGYVTERSLAGNAVWAGFPSLNPLDNHVLAFAGSVPVPGRIYNQDDNYIWIGNLTLRPFWIAPLDRAASTRKLSPQFQGRAGWWSPDGLWIAFESDRNCTAREKTDFQYAIFIQTGSGSQPARQVTACRWNAQHAKWFPSAKASDPATLVVSVLRQPGGPGTSGPRGIAALDVSAFVKLRH